MAYHHGDLRRALLDQAASGIAEVGVAKLSMRAVAERAGVSNAAPTHHFGDKTGLLTALATEGFELLTAAMSVEGDDFGLVERGVAYVDFALQRPSHFTVMFQPHLLRDDDPDLSAARERAWSVLSAGVAATVGALPEHRAQSDFGVAAWSLVHGYATLVLSGAVAPEDPLRQARDVATLLVPEPSSTASPTSHQGPGRGSA